jgi:integrase
VTAVKMMVGLGLRESEALSSRWEWIDWERLTYTPGITKGKEAAPLPMPSWVVDHLGSRKVVEGLIVVSPRGCQYTPGITRDVILKANVSSGVVGLSAHRLRGSFATRLSEAGMPIQSIKLLLRHRDIRTTERYLEVNLDGAAKMQEEIGERLGLNRIGRINGEAERTDARL